MNPTTGFRFLLVARVLILLGSLLLAYGWGHELKPCDRVGWAAESGDIAEVQRFLSDGADPDCLTSRATSLETTLVGRAAWSGRTEVVRLLIQYGANVNLKDTEGRTALHCACYCGHLETARTLLDASADLNAQDKNGKTPLDSAFQGDPMIGSPGHVKLVRFLIKKGGQVGAISGDLHALALMGRKELIELLLPFNPPIDSHSIDLAAVKGHRDVVLLLREHGAEYTAFHAAAIGDLDSVKDFLESDPSLLHARRWGKDTLLISAVSTNQKDVAAYLTERGADINARDASGWTPLHIAANNDSADIAELLLSHGAETETGASRGLTPLHIAAQDSREKVLALLLEHGANVNAKRRQGRTPLHDAIARGMNKERKVDLLVKGGADVNAEDDWGRTPLDYARIRRASENVIEILKAAGAKGNLTDDDYQPPSDFPGPLYEGP